MPPKTDGILESSLYVSDLPRAVRFYEETLGFQVIADFGERGCAMQGGAHQVLLLFKKGASRAIRSPHDGDGELHIAFAIASAELANWEAWLASRGIAGDDDGNEEFLIQPKLAKGAARRLTEYFLTLSLGKSEFHHFNACSFPSTQEGVLIAT